jgi:hypothetical protein
VVSNRQRKQRTVQKEKGECPEWDMCRRQKREKGADKKESVSLRWVYGSMLKEWRKRSNVQNMPPSTGIDGGGY